MRWSHLWLMGLIFLSLVGCQIETRGSSRGRTSPPTAQPTVPTPVVTERPDTVPVPPEPAAQPTGPVRRTLPRIEGEPLIGVLLDSGPEVVLNLPRGGTISYQGERIAVPIGELRVRTSGKGLTTNKTGTKLLGDHIAIQVRPVAGAGTFSTEVTPSFGKPQILQLSGQPEVVIDPASRKAQLIERVGLEQYLRGVLPTEISPSWPMEAIKAQTVVARSYTLDRYLVNNARAWQLHWHYTVDMAYGGFKPLNARMATAIDQTRGQLLVAHNLPIPALFHACSGGQTESAHNFRPTMVGADNITDMTDIMPSVADPAAIAGAEALGMSKTHLDWRVEIPMATVSSALQKWTANHPEEHLRIGQVIAVRTIDRYSDSKRVANVLVRHLVDRQETDIQMSAATFRLAVGPGQIRSTNWTRFVTASAKGGILVVEGRGYGHGVGLSQVSAYQMAKTGSSAADIMMTFYPGSKLVSWW
jgi:SpoIID/LytB domain protein